MRNATIAGLIALGALSACADDPRTSQPEPLARPARQLVESFVPTSAEHLRARIDTLATRERLDTFVREEASRPWGARLHGGIKYADLFAKLYLTDQSPGLVFASRDGITQRGAAVLARLKATRDEGLDPHDYHVERIEALQQSLASHEPTLEETLSLSGAEAEVAVAWLQRRQAELPDDEAARGQRDQLLACQCPAAALDCV